MTTFGFGQRVGQIVQLAYVVEDIDAAIGWWVRDCRVGPWFLLESFTGPGQRYRGQPATADIKLAMSFAGHMNIELIQPKDDRPSGVQGCHRSPRLRVSSCPESPSAMSEPSSWRMKGGASHGSVRGAGAQRRLGCLS